jgi:hypothetical protein
MADEKKTPNGPDWDNPKIKQDSDAFMRFLHESQKTDPDGKKFLEEFKIQHVPGYHPGDDERSRNRPPSGPTVTIPPEFPGDKPRTMPMLGPIIDSSDIDVVAGQPPSHGLSQGKLSSPNTKAK